MGGKPNTGTKKDKRLKENKPKATKATEKPKKNRSRERGRNR